MKSLEALENWYNTESPRTKAYEYEQHYRLIKKDLELLQQYKNIEEEIGIDLITLFKALKNGFYAEHRYIQQCYICFIDGEWAIVNLENDEWWLLKDYGKTWALDKNELKKEWLEK